jgi:chromosome segregation ATPase
MDERKKAIRELEDKGREGSRSVNLMLEDLGESLLVRFNGEGNALPPREDSSCLPEYRRLLKEIDDSEALIKTIEADLEHLKEIEGQITRKEQQNSGYTKNLSGSYARLGELVLEEPLFEDFSASYRYHLETLLPKIKSLEEHLEEIEGKSGASLFSMIGKNAQGMVLRSFLGKSRENLRRLYQGAGEKFAGAGPRDVPAGEIRTLLDDIDDGRKLASDIAADLVLLREERRKIGDAFGIEGGPVKRVQGLEKHISHIREELRKVCLNFGILSADPSIRDEFAGTFTEADLLLLERIEKGRGVLKDYEVRIEKLKASLAIDEEKAEIEKLNRTIEDHKQRIAAGEKSIADLETRIETANRHIGELSLLLGEIPQN